MAERAIHSRNRYSTARKPNLSATATGSSSMSVQVEAEGRGAELDRVAGLERLRAGDAPAVDLHAVGRAEVLDDPLAAARAHLGVAAGNVLVGEHDLAVARAPDHAAARGQHAGLALVAQGLLRRVGLAGAHEPRLDAELAQPQPVIRLEGDLRRGDQGDPLAPRVLEQVARELRGEVALVALELLAVVGREPYGVLVG